jgi:hypothetical protein
MRKKDVFSTLAAGTSNGSAERSPGNRGHFRPHRILQDFPPSPEADSETDSDEIAVINEQLATLSGLAGGIRNNKAGRGL